MNVVLVFVFVMCLVSLIFAPFLKNHPACIPEVQTVIKQLNDIKDKNDRASRLAKKAYENKGQRFEEERN